TLFTSQGIGTKEGFVDAIQNYDYSYRFLEELEKNGLPEGRKYRLEGYLFPDTYEFYTDSSEIAIIDKMLTAFEAHFEGAYYDRLEEMEMTLDEVVTLASIVQMEGKFTSDFYSVSGVFHNRLNSKNMRKLQSDATVQYCLPERKEELSYADIAIDSPYNTYENEGLPPSAITNPGWEAIQAALYPEENRYYYFVSDTDGTIEFAETEQMHLKNRAWLTEAIQNGTTIDVEKEKDGY
ncbi:MAG: endolytic transglycosylase MltG, partial [Clostridia bacterium]|nr:endolytic transglycosylase MltG [Clostridia bacterium]